ncbi:hypothetical protein CANARDRAFT_203020 [[Candida] arabinofermentans NRRL YB-2248]|uniref:Major facilitator superfamily (MFS) profile domain-containing protein n=1 Tax=[Candida] arabinofermentans NRRL YB-2248 TaxID=983967 RepID=A0A1E4SVA7_9ASCO|nr:hypothetical protein CANARDRAFT_203020 [[Candida] arabinofermentans NRRL YB-2248]
MTLSNPSRNKWRVISVVMWAFCAGLSDGAPGALLPSIEAYYNISYLVVSLIWLANACGYIIIALMSHKLEDFLGKRKMTAGGCLYQCIMFALISPGSKYPLVVLGFFFGGLGFATCLSQQNIFLSRFKYSSRYLGYYHGGYGTGACIGPVICTAMVNSGISWHYYYLILLGCTGVNFFNQWFAFEGADEDLKPWDTYDPNSVGPSGTAANISTEYTEPVIPKGILNLALKNSKTWLLSFFVLFYQGAEVALGGWIVTYLEAYRDANASSTGYVASGFWGGLALGRLVLTTLIHKYIGAKRGVWVMLMCSITTALLSWVVPNAIVESVLVSLCGLSIGPIYPLMITIAVRVLPRKIQVVSLTIMTAFGSSGGALFPFLVGLVSQFRGAFVVMPFAIALLSGTATIWYILPNPDRGVINRFYERIW